MMLLVNDTGLIKVQTSHYQLEFQPDRPFVVVRDSYGDRIADLFVLSGVHTLDNRDDTTWIENWAAEEKGGEILLSLKTYSSVWQEKIFTFRCTEDSFHYGIHVIGHGRLNEVDYFGGFYSGQIRWGTGFFWSGQSFRQGFNAEPSCTEEYTFPASSSSDINLTGVPLPGRDNWFFTPPPFHYSFEINNQWLGLGVEARPGENQYGDYQYHGRQGAFYLSLAFDGHTRVSGKYQLPEICFHFGPDPYALLADHVQRLRQTGKVTTPSAKIIPDWWSEPIFCGWGAQCHLANRHGGRAIEYATQANYETFLSTLESQGIHPGTIVLDDKWQNFYGKNEVDPEKWPNLAGFIQDRHAAGQHVLLWLKAWAPEGLPVDECAVNTAGLPVSVDPTNPVSVKRLRKSVHALLSQDGLDADGFKIDFSARIPSGPGIQTWGDAWGIELMRLYLEIIYEEAKAAKPDALIITHTPHPYLADVLDAVRLNDINTGQDVPRQMAHRARVAAIACPEALIDMDNWPMPNKTAWRDYLRCQPLNGIPALYYADAIDSSGEMLTKEDYTLLRSVWAEYRDSKQRTAPARNMPLPPVPEPFADPQRFGSVGFEPQTIASQSISPSR